MELTFRCVDAPVDLNIEAGIGTGQGNDSFSGDFDIFVASDRSDSLVVGEAGGDFRGARGSDLMVGGPLSDHLNGGRGRDRLRGRRGPDWLYGGKGDDVLRGGRGSDTGLGGGGNDRCRGIENRSSC